MLGNTFLKAFTIFSLIFYITLFCNKDTKINNTVGLCQEAFQSWGFEAIECKNCRKEKNYVLIYLDHPVPKGILGLTIPFKHYDMILISNSFSYANGKYNLKAVMKHEVGHVLGLFHSPDPDDLMFEAANKTTEPSNVDYVLAQANNLGRRFYCEIEYYQPK